MKLMPNCRQVARTVSSDESSDLPLWRWLLMRWHLLICGDCVRYVRQIEAISSAARELELSPELDAALESDQLRSLEAVILEELTGSAGREMARDTESRTRYDQEVREPGNPESQ